VGTCFLGSLAQKWLAICALPPPAHRSLENLSKVSVLEKKFAYSNSVTVGGTMKYKCI